MHTAATRPREDARSRTFPQRNPIPRWQRLLFAFALITVALASSFSATNLLSRAWPALFPGQTLSLSVPSAVSVLPGVKPVLDRNVLPHLTSANEDSAFLRTRNFLVLGLDKRPGEPVNGHLTDVIMVAAVDPTTKQTSLLSFPRDMLIDIHTPEGDTWRSRINNSYAFGYENGGSVRAGAEQVMRDMRENFDIEIDHWVILDFTGVETLVDAIGGVDVDIPADLSVPEWRYSDDDATVTWVEFPPGEQHLDGYEAVAFGRYRNDSDLKRVKRQQLIVAAALGKVDAQDLLNDPRGLWDAYKDTVITDLSTVEAIGLAPLARQTAGSVRAFSVGDPVRGRDTMFSTTLDSGAAVLEWDRENVEYWINQALSGPRYADAEVEIQNATGSDRSQQAEGLAHYLLFKGLPHVYLGSDIASQNHTEIVVYDPEAREMAEDVAAWMNLPTSVIRMSDRQDPVLPDVAVVIGSDFELPGG